MPRPKPIGETLSEALNFSIHLEERRGDLTPFELKRLEALAYPKEGNYFQYLVKEMLVAETKRDYERFDAAADRFLENAVPGDLLVNMSSSALFALSPRHVSAMIRRLATECPDWLEGLMLVQSAAFFVGDLGLSNELRERIARLGGEMEQEVRDVQAGRILAAAGIEPDSYHGFVQGVYALVRKYVSEQYNTRLVLDVTTQLHEDGHESIVYQVFSSLEDEQLDRLDDELLEYASSPEAVESGVPNVVTVLVRDMPAFQAEGAA